MSQVSIREATRNDMPEVAWVFRASWVQSLAFLPVLHTPEEDVEFFGKTIFDEDDVYVAEDRATRRIVGFIAFNSEFVDHLYLLPEKEKMPDVLFEWNAPEK